MTNTNLNSFDFTVPGKAVPYMRPGVRVLPNGRPCLYDPPKVSKYKDYVRSCFTKAYPLAVPLPGPLMCRIAEYRAIPASWNQKMKRLAMEGILAPTTRADGDNVFKAAADALTGLAWVDDAQIVSLTFHKLYSPDPRLTISVWPSTLPGGSLL